MKGLGLTVLPGDGVNQIGGSLIRLKPDEGPELLLDAGLPLFKSKRVAIPCCQDKYRNLRIPVLGDSDGRENLRFPKGR